MPNDLNKHIFLVDDDPDVRLVVSRTLEQIGSKVTCFAFGAECLKQLHSQRCDLLITNLKMPDMDGIKLLTEAKRLIPTLPVLLITAYGDTQTAVRGFKAGASDFIEKPLDKQTFLSAVESVLKQHTKTHPLVGKVLTKTEMRVLRLILDGKSNKEIARSLHRSVRTIEDHRAHIMYKFGVDNVLDLFKEIAVIRMPDLEADE